MIDDIEEVAKVKHRHVGMDVFNKGLKQRILELEAWKS